MLIYTNHTTARLKYVLNFIFSDVFDTSYRLTGNGEEFASYQGAKINYSTGDTGLPGDPGNPGHSDHTGNHGDTGLPGDTVHPDVNGNPGDTGDAFTIPVSGLLSDEGINEINPRLHTSGSLPLLFYMGNGSQASAESKEAGLDFDLFSAVFYMISRYEEYLPFKPDRYGRFEAGSSLAAENGFLEIPVVDLWVNDFREKLLSRFKDLPLRFGDFRFLPTCDIDLPFAYLHRGRVRRAGARIKAGIQGASDSKLRRDVLSGIVKDPFDTFSEIEAIHSLYNLRPRIFFLTARYGKYDKSISPGSAVFKELVGQAMKYADVGIHPSCRASDKPSELQKEIRKLSGIAGEEITGSRQHFLKFRLPQSYRNYIAAGIQEEYSMGFASAAGFRAGTSRPFFFYDLLSEEETTLKVMPFLVMDRTLKDYMKLTPTQALEKISSLAGTVRSAGGTFCSIWHNDAFSDHGEWEGWKDVYLQMINSLIV